MTASRSCRACGAELPGDVTWCLRCYEPVRQLTPRDPGAPSITFLRDPNHGFERSRWKAGVNTFGPFGRIIATVLVLALAPLSVNLVSLVVVVPCYLFLAVVVLRAVWKKARVLDMSLTDATSRDPRNDERES